MNFQTIIKPKTELLTFGSDPFFNLTKLSKYHHAASKLDGVKMIAVLYLTRTSLIP